MTRLGEVLAQAKQRLAGVSTSASLDAQLLLMEVSGFSRAQVLAYPETILTPEQAAAYEALIARREQGEPVAYILGRRAWYDREFIVAPGVLIPRPETELLLEEALNATQQLNASDNFIAVDVGTGSGALAVTFAALRPAANVYAIDLSTAALHIAKRNAHAQQAAVHFLQGDLLLPLIDLGVQADLIMANLPYIPQDEVPTLEVSRYEPVLALDGGEDGLMLVRRLLEQIPRVARSGTLVLLEIGAGQGAAALKAVHAVLTPQEAIVMPDYAGHDRIVKIRL